MQIPVTDAKGQLTELDRPTPASLQGMAETLTILRLSVPPPETAAPR